MVETLTRALSVAVGFGLAGVAVTLAFVLEAKDPTAVVLSPMAGLAGGLAAAVAWPHRAASLRPREGALRGAAVGALAHPVLWMLMLTWTGMRTPGLETGPAEVVAPALVFATLSTLAYGPLTVATGTAVGSLFALTTIRRVDEGRARTSTRFAAAEARS